MAALWLILAPLELHFHPDVTCTVIARGDLKSLCVCVRVRTTRAYVFCLCKTVMSLFVTILPSGEEHHVPTYKHKSLKAGGVG